MYFGEDSYICELVGFILIAIQHIFTMQNYDPQDILCFWFQSWSIQILIHNTIVLWFHWTNSNIPYLIFITFRRCYESRKKNWNLKPINCFKTSDRKFNKLKSQTTSNLKNSLIYSVFMFCNIMFARKWRNSTLM